MKQRWGFLLLIASIGIISSGHFAASQAASVAQVKNQSMTQQAPESLINTEWLLEDLSGTGVMDYVQTTLRFDEANHISGRGGCNRYRAEVQLEGDRLTISPVASTKMLCPPAVMNQESRYFQALQTAQRISLEGPYLLIYSEGIEVPLKFTRLTPTASETPSNKALRH